MKKFCTVMLLVALTAVSCSKETTEEDIFTEASAVPAIEQELLSLINDYRVSLGYNSMEHNAVAYAHAAEHNDYMIAKGSLNHDNFSSRASSISLQVNALKVAENVAKDYPTALKALQEWLKSSGHKENIEGDFTHTGISVKMDGNGDLYYTQLFFK